MTKNQRVITIIKSLLLILVVFVINSYPDYSYRIIVLLIDISFLFKGITQLIYFFTMARHKVGGLSILFKSIWFIDLGLFIIGYGAMQKNIVMIYLIILAVFSTVVSIMNSIKCRKIKSPAWKTHLVKAIITIVLAVFCAIFIESSEIATILFSVFLLMNAASGIMLCFMNTEMYYIEV